MTVIESAGASSLARASGFQLGPLEVRPPTREVIGARDAVVLEPRIMQVLVALARRRGEVVSRSELIDECWGGRAVGDDAINRCIQAIRRLADAEGGFSIRTVARVGYRLDETDADTAPCRPLAGAGKAVEISSLIPQARERRHLTILSCALVRPAGTAVDPEAGYAIAAAWRGMIAAATARFGGHVESARGDHMLVCFGYPEALEDAGERAVRAALEIVERMDDLNSAFPGPRSERLAVRTGIHSGTMVVARGEGGEVELFGEALDIAGRIEGLAAIDTVIVSSAVLDKVSGRFVVEPQGEVDDGRGGLLHLHSVRSAAPAGGQATRRELSGFVGREEEMALLHARWGRVRQGAGQLILIHGEPGIGKSRLVSRFQESIAADDPLWIECRGEQLFANSPFHASAQMLRRGLGWSGDESAGERSVGLERALEDAGLKVAEALPLVGEMLGLQLPGHLPPLMLAPEQRRRRLLATLARWLFAAAGSRPLVLAIEDLHWLDPSSLELLHTLAEQGAGLPLMLLCTARPEFHASWPARAHHIQIALDGLAPTEMHDLVSALAAENGLGGGSIQTIVERADGIPLFGEELARLVAEQSDSAEIPATLMDSLAARLDRLGDAQETARIGAVIGRDFSWDLLRAVSTESDEALQAALDRLAAAGLIQARGASPDSSYRFRHALIRDAAYSMLLAAQRRDRHRRVAEAILKGVAPAEPEELAHHWTEAGDSEQALAAWAQAAAIFYSRHAFGEAASAYRRALSILSTLPQSPERDSRELELSAGFALVLIPTQGSRSEELARITARNQDLAQRSGDLAMIVTARTYRFVAASLAGDWHQADRLGEQVAELADHAGGQAPREAVALARAMGHYCRFTTAFYCGRLEESEAQYSCWEALNDKAEYAQRAVIAMSYGNGSLLAWHLGNLDEAGRRSECAQAFAREAGNPFDRGAAGLTAALLSIAQRDVAGAESAASQMLALAREHGFGQIEGWTGACLGWAQAQRDDAGEGVALIRSSLLLLAASQTRVTLPWFLTMLGEAQALGGDADGALASFEEALSVAPAERQYRPLTLISRAEHWLRLGDRLRAEKDYREAVALSETMGALSCKLRAMTGLASLHGGKEMRARLADLVGRIVGGADTRDLLEARAVIDAT